MSEGPIRLTEDQLRQRRSRNLALALVLVGLVVLFFIVTLIQFQGQLNERM